MLARLADVMDNPLSEKDASFTDNSAISPWAVNAVGQVQAAGVMSGVGDGKFAPAGDYTREQSIVTIMRLVNLVI